MGQARWERLVNLREYHPVRVSSPIPLRPFYAVSGTAIAYHDGISLRASSAMSGTAIAYDSCIRACYAMSYPRTSVLCNVCYGDSVWFQPPPMPCPVPQ
eukprot:956821-Rhodomonas_salina.2